MQSFYIIQMAQNSQLQSCLPIEIAKSMYSKWDAEVALIQQPNFIYAKTLQGTSYLEFKNGNTYDGQVARGLLHGKGIFKWTSGVVYEGEFRNNIIEGKGKYTWPDGSVYVGEVVAGKKEGYGEFTSVAENATYCGQWKKGHRDGKGRVEFGNGSVFQGNFKDGIKDGFGKMIYPSGNYYEGMWVNDIKEGQGTMVWQTTNQKYIGNWHNNKQNGHGTHIWMENKAQFKVLRNRYEGNWIEGRREGFGTFFYSNGSRYDGYWHNNMKEGFGLLTEENGELKWGLYKADRLVKKDLQMTKSPTAVQLQQNIQPTTLLPPIKALQNMNSKQLKPLGQLRDLKKVSKKPTSKQPLKKYDDIRQTVNHSPQKQSNPIIPPLQPTSSNNPPPISNILRNLDAEQNPYVKYLDIEDFPVTESIQNFLLRSHSSLKLWYKQYSGTHEYFSGMSLESVWKMVRDLKIIDENCNPSRIDREFAKGFKSMFPLGCGSQNRLRILQKVQHINEADLVRIEINYHAKQLAEQPFNWNDLLNPETPQTFNVQNNPFQLSNLHIGKDRNIHDASSIIFFRHFVCILVRIAKLKYCIGSTKESDLKAALEKVFSKLSQLCDNKQHVNISTIQDGSKMISMDNSSLKSGFAIGKVVLEWAKSLNQRLFERMTAGQRNLIGVHDRTVLVRTLYKLLDKAGLFKDAWEKMVFLEKIQRYMDVKSYYFRKDLKPQAAGIISLLEKSPAFYQILNAQLNLWEFSELLYATFTKKFSNLHNQDQIKQKYEQTVDGLGRIHEQAVKEESSRIKCTIPLRKVQTQKDKLKLQMLKRLEEEKKRRAEEQEAQRIAEMEEHERLGMEINDFNVPSEAYLEQSDDDM